VFFSDHGQAFGSKRNYYRHGNFLFNSILRVPLIIKPPHNRKFPEGIRIKQKVSLKDVLPTVAELEGVELDDEGLDGESLVPFLGQDPDPSYEFWNYAETLRYDDRMTPLARGAFRVGFSIMNDNWKLIAVPEYEEQDLYRAEDVREDENFENAEVIEALHVEALKRFGLETVEDIVRVEKISISEETQEMLRALGYH
jgi:arylsulfatase A-like enzyme